MQISQIPGKRGFQAFQVRDAQSAYNELETRDEQHTTYYVDTEHQNQGMHDQETQCAAVFALNILTFILQIGAT